MHAETHANSMQKLMPGTLPCKGQPAVHETAGSLAMPEMALCSSVDKQQPTFRLGSLKSEPSAAALEASVHDGPGVHASTSLAAPIAAAAQASPTTLCESIGANTASLTPVAADQGPLQPSSEPQRGCTMPVTSPTGSGSQHDTETQHSAGMQAPDASKLQAAVRPQLWQVSHSCSLLRVMHKMRCIHRSSCVCCTLCFSSVNKPLHPFISKLSHFTSERV